MAIATPGTKITAAHYIGLRTRLNAILGDAGLVEYLGYGQIPLSSQLGSQDVAQNAKILAAQWIALRNDIQMVRQHQTGAVFATSSLPSISATTKITAAHANAFDTCITAVSQTPLEADVTSMSTTAQGSPRVHGATWGGTGGVSISIEETVTFSSINAARYFFNSGGAVRFTISHPSTTGAYNLAWRNVLTAVGVISVKAKATSTSTAVSPGSLGFYDMGSSYTRMFYHTAVGGGGLPGSGSGGSYYGGDTVVVVVDAKRAGASITFKVILSDKTGGAIANNVDAGTALAVSTYRAVIPLVNIESPSNTPGTWVKSATHLV